MLVTGEIRWRLRTSHSIIQEAVTGALVRSCPGGVVRRKARQGRISERTERRNGGSNCIQLLIVWLKKGAELRVSGLGVFFREVGLPA